MAKQTAISKMVPGKHYAITFGDEPGRQTMRFIGVPEMTKMYGEHKYPAMWLQNAEGVLKPYSLQEAMAHGELDKFECAKPGNTNWAHRWVFEREDGTLLYVRYWVEFRGERRVPCLMCYGSDQNAAVHVKHDLGNGVRLSIYAV